MTEGRPYKKRLIILGVLVAVLVALLYILPAYPASVACYISHIFQPFQSLRNTIFGNVPFSFGDIIYISAGILLLVFITRCVFFLSHFRQRKHSLAASLLRGLTGLCIIYLLFFLGWAGNYNSPSLSEVWQLNDNTLDSDTTLYAFDRYLIAKLNSEAPHYHSAPFEEIALKAVNYYRSNTDMPAKLKGLKVKPSLFGQLMQYMGVQGYYNPFTGEAQVNSHLPDFLLPFVICHELGHQTGIAAEDDANLLAYALNTKVNDTTFNYSGHFNLWLYVHSRLKMEDSATARRLYKTLNPISVAHLDTLRAINKRYRSSLSRYSNGFYDGYLRFHHVKEGIESYEDVVQSAYAWEQRSINRKDSLIHIP